MSQTNGQSYTIAEAAALTGLHKNTIRLRVKMGQLPAQRAMGKFGEEYRISQRALVEAGLLTPPEPLTTPAISTDPAGNASLSTHTPAPPLPGSPQDTLYRPSQEPLSDLFQRHEHAMFRLGFLEAELARHKALAENAESLQAAAREREMQIRQLRQQLERAEERAREIDELRTLVREMEQDTERMREEVEAHRAAAPRPWWQVFGRRQA
jgi:excisionase family DNA binding protein